MGDGAAALVVARTAARVAWTWLGGRLWREGAERVMTVRPCKPVYPQGESVWCTVGISPLMGRDEATSPHASRRPDSQRRRTLP
jgi:hypothetical protein